MMKFLLRFTALLLVAGAPLLAQAELRITTDGVGSKRIPVAIAEFADEGQAPEQISAIIKADLSRSGYFTIIDTPTPMSETANVNYADWKSRNALALAVGSVQKLADGRFVVRYRLFDTTKGAQSSGFAETVYTDRLRLAAHKISDDIYEKLTGVPGDFSTRIAYVTKEGRAYKLVVADADGKGEVDAMRSSEPIISPVWSPDGTHIACVSFEKRKPIVFVVDLVHGEHHEVANFKGNNSAPAWSPDGSKLAVALTLSGNTQIYLISAAGGGTPQRLTSSSDIDTEPRFSPDGQSIYFTSNRGGGPQIYRVGVGGGNAQRVTFSGDFNTSPRISPDGKTLAYVSRRGGQFDLYVLDLATNQELRLSNGSMDEAPSFSPNGRYIMYSTDVGHRKSLAVVSVDGSVKQALMNQAVDISEPTWGPFMK